jgi:hypothetical protein
MARALRQGTDDSAKRALRVKLLSLLPSAPAVIETHAGDGNLSALYHQAERHAAVDTNKSYSAAIHLDSRDFLRCVDLDAFNFFDIDAYGNPLEWVWLISQLRKSSSSFALAITSGFCCGAHRTRKTLYDAGFSRQMLEAIDARPGDRFSGVWQEDHGIAFFRRCFFSWFPDFAITHFEAIPGYKPKTKNDLICYYFGVYFEPKTDLPPELARDGARL